MKLCFNRLYVLALRVINRLFKGVSVIIVRLCITPPEAVADGVHIKIEHAVVVSLIICVKVSVDAHKHGAGICRVSRLEYLADRRGIRRRGGKESRHTVVTYHDAGRVLLCRIHQHLLKPYELIGTERAFFRVARGRAPACREIVLPLFSCGIIGILSIKADYSEAVKFKIIVTDILVKLAVLSSPHDVFVVSQRCGNVCH